MAVTVSCKNLTITEQCSAILTQGRGMLNGPIGFALHCVPSTAQQYLNMQREPYGQGETYFTEYPKSVNYLISQGGFVWELVPPQDQSWGFSGFFQPSWPTLLQYPNLSSPNEPFVNIGYEGNGEPTPVQLSVMVNLICCLALELGIPLTVMDVHNVVFPTQIDTRLTCPSSLPDTLITSVGMCIENGGVSLVAGNITAISKCVDELKKWRDETVDPELCRLAALTNTHTTQIAALMTQVSNLTTIVQSFESSIATITEQNEALVAQVMENTKKIALQQICIEELCAVPEIQCIHYQLLPNDGITVTPGTNRRITLPTKITDTDPPTAQGSALQSFCLNQPCTYNIQGVARFSFGAWCKDRIARLILIACSQEIILDEFVIPADGNYTVTLEGSTTLVVPPACIDTHLVVFTDDVTTPNKVIEFADIQICCDGLSCPPSDLTSLLPPIGKT